MDTRSGATNPGVGNAWRSVQIQHNTRSNKSNDTRKAFVLSDSKNRPLKLVATECESNLEDCASKLSELVRALILAGMRRSLISVQLIVVMSFDFADYLTGGFKQAQRSVSNRCSIIDNMGVLLEETSF
jgi:hypothetical protein